MRVILKQPHTHAGRPHAPGDELDLTERDARWLQSIHSADLAEVPSAEDSAATLDLPSIHGDDHVVE
jgi:hypothetical protein